MDLTVLMNTATADLTPPPDLLQTVCGRGARRKQRRNAGVAALVVTGLVGSASAAPAVRRFHQRSRTQADFAGSIFDGRTHGDLAQDSNYLTAVLQAWDGSHATSANADRGIFRHLLGKAVVAWAGNTPVGPAAVVTQRADLGQHSDLPSNEAGSAQLLGFIGPDPTGRPRVVGDTYPSGGVPPSTAWYVDPKRTYLAAIDDSFGRGLSYGLSYQGNGAVIRSFVPMPNDDGVALAAVPAGIGLQNLTVNVLPGGSPDDLVNIAGTAPRGNDGVDRRLGTGVTGNAWLGNRVVAGSPSEHELARALDTATVAATQASFSVEYDGLWLVAGRTKNGLEFACTERALDADPSRLYVLLRHTGHPDDLRDVGSIGTTTALPVQFRLPGDAGTVVARYGATLDYRVGTGAWHSAGRDAALLPAAATAVRVTENHRNVAIVALAPGQ